ncbi:MAG: DNA primase [Methanomassiliicoccales archaeon]|nr:MAG: DNA primase [Methanomassiliicoccales archaeon]
MHIDPTTTKYLIQARMEADGIVEKPDVVGAIFGQTEGLLGEELDLRDLQKSGRIGRIEVEVSSKKGKSEGTIMVPSSLDQVETSILASSLETIDRVGPCKAKIRVEKVEDVRVSKRMKIVDRAKELLTIMIEQSKHTGMDLTESVKAAVQVHEIVTMGPDRLPAGPNAEASDAIIIVEGRADVLNLLRSGVKNAVSVEGTNIPKSIQDLSREKVVTAFVDGDRGGELILRELLQVGEIDFVARAPKGKEVEELTQKQIMKLLRNKIPVEQFVDMYGLRVTTPKTTEGPERPAPRRRVERREERPRAPPRKEEKKLSPEQEKLKEMLDSLSGTLKARLINKEGEVTVEVPVRDLVDTLKSQDNTATVVFDGIITQRILDLAASQGTATVVGTKIGNVSKHPASVEVWTKNDLGI